MARTSVILGGSVRGLNHGGRANGVGKPHGASAHLLAEWHE